MNAIISCLVFAVAISSPVQGYCSYYKTSVYANQNKPFSIAELDLHKYARCLLQIDLIKKTKDKEKKDRLKMMLEVDLLCLLDYANFLIEEDQKGIIYQTEMRDEGSLPERNWDKYILNNLEEIERWKETCAEIEQLIYQHTR